MQIASRWTVKQAATWKIVAGIFERNHARYRSLRVLETHPGGGQYDCVSLYLLEPQRHVCSFNVASGHFHPFGGVGGQRRRLDELSWPEGNNYVEAMLRAEDPQQVLDEIEDVLGFDGPRSNASQVSPVTLCLGTMATLLSQMVFENGRFEARCAWYDSSGGCGSVVCEWAYRVPAVERALRRLRQDGPWRERARIAARLWRIEKAGTERSVIFDLSTAIAYPAERRPVSLSRAYEKTASIPHLVSLVTAPFFS